jgi:hypothetical protein
MGIATQVSLPLYVHLSQQGEPGPSANAIEAYPRAGGLNVLISHARDEPVPPSKIRSMEVFAAKNHFAIGMAR